MKTRNLFYTVALASLNIVAMPAAFADTAILPDNVVKAHLKKFEASFSRAPGVTFTEKIGVQTTGTTKGPETRFLDLTGEITKPPKFKYTMPTAGTLISDGVSELALDPAKTHYNLHAASKAFTVGDRWDFVSTKVLTGAAAILDEALVPYLYEHISSKDFLEPTEMQLTGFNNVIDGKNVIDIDYKNDTDDVHIFLDPKTDSLVGTHAIYMALNGLRTEVIETISNISLLPSAPPAADFVTTPPPGAAPVVIPTEPVTPPTTTKKQKQTTPKKTTPTPRRMFKIGKTWVVQ